ncbi:MAG: Gfo/Idh/MocA family oxidoreductase [Acidobacteriota bacterium]|nr:Gfo/Idh/MocA family oxidoreductase [Acidobacteriota bacterium]
MVGSGATLPEQAPVRTALVGFGFGGSVFHAPFIEAEPRLDLVAIVTADPGRQAAARLRYPDAEVVATPGELLRRDDGADLVVISTPNRTHVPLAEEFLGAGRHLVVDKPVAPSATDVRRLAAEARRAGRLLVPFHNRRWDADFRTLQALLEQGRLGRLHRLESRYERWQPTVDVTAGRAWKRDPTPGHGGGILYDLGTHLIDQACLLLGRPQSVYAEVGSVRPGAEVDDDVFVGLTFAGGVRAHLWTSAVAAQRGPRFRALGGEAAYVKFGMDPQESALVGGARPGGPGWGEEPPAAWGAWHAGDSSEAVPSLPGDYGLFYRGLASALLDGTPPPVGPADALLVAEIIEAAQVSAGQGRVVTLTEA